MAHAGLGGGAEAHGRFRQHDFRGNSNLVLATDSLRGDGPTGEPESLWGKIDRKSFGDRAYRGRPLQLDEKRRLDHHAEPPLSRQGKRRRLQEESVLTSTEEGHYMPKTKQTRSAYEVMLSVIEQQLGGQPLSIVSGAADEILAVLKDDSFKNPDKKKEIEKLLNPIPNHVFDQLVSIGRLITDYPDGSDAAGLVSANRDGALDDDIGVAVEFEENEEEEENDLDMIKEDEEDEHDVAEPNGSGAMQMDWGIDDDYLQENDGGMNLNVQDIDAYWLQRKISQAYGQKIDPQQCQNLAEEVLKILAEGDGREIETKLLVHLQFDKFSLIKFLLRNRLKVVWCTRLARSEDQEERKKIEEEMMHLGPDLAAILEQLYATRATAKERQKNLEKSIREEAHQLGGSEPVQRDMDNGGLTGQSQLLDLDSIAFQQDSHLMANDKCVLPDGSYRHLGKGYEEIYVPKLTPKPFDSEEKFVEIASMPDWAQLAFKGMTQLNRVQSKVYETALFVGSL